MHNQNENLHVIENTARLTKPIDHIVQFYTSEAQLMTPLARYIQKGLRAKEACVIVATPEHIELLYRRLNSAGLSSKKLQAKAQLYVYDVTEMLSKFMVNGMPNKAKFMATIGKLVGDLGKKYKGVRIYGEMVALLWKHGNKAALLELEKLWNELGALEQFSLYCGYPLLHFIMDGEALHEISTYHSGSLSKMGSNYVVT